VEFGDIFDGLKRFGRKPALITSELTLSFEELRDLTAGLAASLQEAGVRKGSHVAILLSDSIDYCIAYGAIWLSGAVAVPLHIGMKPETVLGLLSHSESEFLFLHESHPLSPADIRERVSSIRWIACEKADADAKMDALCRNAAGDFKPPEVADSEICGIFYTSGTTGEPKGIVWNYRHLDAPLMIMEHFLGAGDNEVQICAAPLSHSGGLVYYLHCLKYGMPVVLMDRFLPGAFLRNVERYGVTRCFLVPAMFSAIVRDREFENADLSSLNWVATFGAAADLGALQKLQEKCPELVIINGWGMMESAPPNTLPHLDRTEIDLRGVGFPPPWIEMRVVSDTGKELSAGETGEVVLRGWVVMEGYYKNPELTGEVIRDGWLHTGDLGYVDERGYFYIAGRKKDVIIVGGLNVHAEEVEQALRSHPAVAEAAVVATEDRTRGEVVKAHIVLKQGTTADDRELTEFCRMRLEAQKVPKVFCFVDNLPRTSTGKVAKWGLK
jgi:acyl-CoA synthetase (AMP-forming)/AMP-acid ligase II